MDRKDLRVLGIDIGGSSVKMGLLDGDRGLEDITKADTITGEPERMADVIAEMALRYAPDIVGVGCAGAVNRITGLVSASNLKWKAVGLRKMLEDRIKRPVWLDNDAQAALMAEVHSGVLTGVRCAVYVTLGTGVGGALLIDGKPWRGDDNTAFELGHIITHAGGLECTCGKFGCFECYASISALSRYARGKPARSVIDGALAGVPEDLRTFDVYLGELGVGIASVANLFHPETVVIGGGISAAGDVLIRGIGREMDKLISGRSGLESMKIKLAAHKNNAGMIGAAALAKLHLSDYRNN